MNPVTDELRLNSFESIGYPEAPLMLTTMSDYELADYLARKGALERWKHVNRSTVWMDGQGRAVAVALYTGAAGRAIYIMRESAP